MLLCFYSAIGIGICVINCFEVTISSYCTAKKESSSSLSKNINDKDLKEKFKNKISYYAGKRIATIKIYVKNRKSAIKKNESLIDLVFDIKKINSLGLLESTPRSLVVLYYQDDIEKKKVSLKDVHKFMKLCADGILGSSVIGGIKFSKLMNTLKEKKIIF